MAVEASEKRKLEKSIGPEGPGLESPVFAWAGVEGREAGGGSGGDSAARPRRSLTVKLRSSSCSLMDRARVASHLIMLSDGISRNDALVFPAAVRYPAG